ncbi:hypothetical protein [Azospirillum brasilense]|uniref:hypothetical protein n=1 Tax=Azospirillum brasilense TaxID=192 RepID=UPI0011EF1E21|nr:hypothetical protein [Azospirillum brasilense]
MLDKMVYATLEAGALHNRIGCFAVWASFPECLRPSGLASPLTQGYQARALLFRLERSSAWKDHPVDARNAEEGQT